MEELGRLDIPLGRLRQEMPQQGQDVLAALAHRRQTQFQDLQPVVQIGPEPPLGHATLQVGVGRGDQADVGPPFGRIADGLVGAVLQQAQQLGLQFQRQVADLVQEQGAAVRPGRQADPGRLGAGERAAHVAEELPARRSREGIAVTLTQTNSASRRELFSCRRRANSSLPVPVSPVTSTGSFESANASHSCSRSRMRLETCTMGCCPCRSPGPVRRRAVLAGPAPRFPVRPAGPTVRPRPRRASLDGPMLDIRAQEGVQGGHGLLPAGLQHAGRIRLPAGRCPAAPAGSAPKPRRALAASNRASNSINCSAAATAWREAESRSPMSSSVSAMARRATASSKRSPWRRAMVRAVPSTDRASEFRPSSCRHCPCRRMTSITTSPSGAMLRPMAKARL